MHLQVCAESKHLFLSLQKKRCLQNYLFWDWISFVLDVLEHFFPRRVKGEEKPLRPSGDCVSVDWGHGYVPIRAPSPSLFSLCHWQGPLVPGVGIFTVSQVLQAGTRTETPALHRLLHCWEAVADLQ